MTEERKLTPAAEAALGRVLDNDYDREETLADRLERAPFLEGYPVHLTVSKYELVQIIAALRAHAAYDG